jgi:hypothetical protein
MRSSKFYSYTYFALAISFILIFHLIFSKYGFNPTDDGHVLAHAKRILNGEIPHRDFISIRPAFSSFLHSIEIIIFPAEKIFYYSRFVVIFFFFTISQLTINLFNNDFNQELKKIFFFIIIFLFISHNFSIMTWTTIDGILFCLIGFYLIKIKKKKLGYLVLSISYLCKQSFIFMPFIIIIANNDYKKIKYYIFSLFPLIIYSLYLLHFNALEDFINQIQGEKIIYLQDQKNPIVIKIIFFILNLFNVNEVAVSSNIELQLAITKSLIVNKFLILGFLFYFFLRKFNKYNYILFFIILTSFLFVNFFNLSFIITGFNLAIYCEYLFLKFYKNANQNQNYNHNYISIVIFGLALSYCSMLSVGYPYTILGCSISLYIFLFELYKKDLNNKSEGLILIIALAVILFGKVSYERFYYTYREPVLSQLSYPLEKIFPGTYNIYTNKNTYAVINDLNELKKIKKKIAVIPDIVGYWVATDEKHPLIADWLNSTEVPKNQLNKLKKNIHKFFDSGGSILITKFRTDNLWFEFSENFSDYNIITYVKKNFSKNFETKFFEVYSK